MDTKHLDDIGVTNRVPNAPDPSSTWEDPVGLLQVDPQSAYPVIEDLIRDRNRVEFWCQYLRGLGKVADKDLVPKPAVVSEEMMQAIVDMGFIPAAWVKRVTSESAEALLRNPEALSDLHVRVTLSDSPYWLAKRQMPVPSPPTPEPVETIAQEESKGRIRRHVSAAARFVAEYAQIAAVVALVACAAGAGAGVALDRILVSEQLEYARAERQEAEAAVRDYEAAWAVLEFKEIIKATAIEALPGDLAGRPNRVRVELSERVASGLIRDVSVLWGDAGDTWKRIWEAEGDVRQLDVWHDYALPPTGESKSWVLRVLFTVPDAVERARQLTPDQLTCACAVHVTAEGIRLAPVTSAKGPAPLLSSAVVPEIKWLRPRPGSQVGWRATAEIVSESRTERVTLLVRPEAATNYYVQPGARPLSANISESFEIQLAGGPSNDIGKVFDILAVISDGFDPPRWNLSWNEVPSSSVSSRVRVRKAAGTILLVGQEQAVDRKIRVKGEIWTPEGGALLVKLDDGRYRVVRVIPHSPAGGSFDYELALESIREQPIYLMVQRDGAPEPQVGQILMGVPPGSYWLYGPAKPLEEVMGSQ